MKTENSQAPFRIITLGSIQIEDNQIEKPSTKKLPAWLHSKLHVIRQLKDRMKMLIRTESECCLNLDFQMQKTHAKSFVFEILFIGDNSSTFYLFADKV